MSAPLPLLRGWRRRVGALLALAAVFLARGGRGSAEEPGEPVTLLLSRVETDPSGRLEGLLEQAEAARREGAFVAAVDQLAEASAFGPDVLVPVPQADPERAALRWPAARVIEQLAADLPPAARAALAQRVHGGASALAATQARQGSEAALERLARAPVLDSAGEEALLLRAERALERGAANEALDLFGRWEVLASSPAAGAALLALREPVAARIVVALAMQGDQAALALRAAAPAPSAEGAPPPAPPSVLEARRRLAALRSPRVRTSPRDPPELPTRLVRAWQRDLTDPGLRGESDATRDLVSEAIVADGDALWVHEGRRVRRLDSATGRERWAFPPGPLGWDHDPFVKYEPHDRPLRWVGRHGDMVLAVLGDPGGTGAFAQGEAQLDIDTGTRESRTRLVALDAATGRLRWHTGTLREAHPELGDRATSCASPPLVVGNDVYVLFARRFGVAEIYAACLALDTGLPRWVRFLAAAESGRDPGVSAQGGREDRARVRAVPWGQRPTLADGELCVVPHAGFAAGLDAARGTLTWLRALPRFAPAELPLARSAGASARNAPLALPGAWALLPMDAPVLLALEHGSGRLRWHTPALAAGLAPAWRDLVRVARDAEGSSVLRVVGAAPVHLDPFHGVLLAAGQALAPDDPDTGTTPGRALDLGGAVAVLERGEVVVRRWPGEAPGPDAGRIGLEGGGEEVAPDEAPLWGDLAREGPWWYVLEPGRLSAWIDAGQVAACFGPVGAGASPDAAFEATAAGVLHDGERLVRALEGLAADPGARDVVARVLEGFLQRAPAPDEAPGARAALVQRLRTHVPSLPGSARIYLPAARVLREARAFGELVDLLGEWIDAAPGMLRGAPESPSDDPLQLRAPRQDIRGDLLAALVLRGLREEPAAAAALERRERDTAARLESALASGDLGLEREALRRAAGTRALGAARAELAARAAAAGDFARAARLIADLRLDPPSPREGREAEARADAARWQLAEAGWRVGAGDLEGARALLEDLRRWVPSGLKDAEGLTTSDWLERLRTQHGWHARRGADLRAPLDAWPDETGPLHHDRRGSVVVPSLEGPGATRMGDRFLLCRGLGIEIWSLAGGERVARLESGDMGWFGGTLQDATPWLPERGVRVVATVAGEPADRAGFEAGDWLLAWGGAPVEGTADLMRRIAGSEPDRAIEVTRVRSGQSESVRFAPGRRPAEEARDVLGRARLWVAADGRVLVPTRLGVLRVDLEQARAEPFWRSTEPGTVQRLVVTGGQAYACLRRLHHDDLLVALDVRTGRELWRADVPGSIDGVESCGSGLRVSLEAPTRTLLLDADDGRLRVELAATEPLRPPRGAVLPARGTLGANAGRLYALVPWALHGGVYVVNSTTLRARLEVAEGARRGSRAGFEPTLSVGSFVGLMLGPSQIVVLEPDALGEGFVRTTRLGAGELLTEQLHHGGELDFESRLIVRGETLYVLRYQPRQPGSPRRGVTVMTFGRIDDARGRLRFTVLDHEPPASRTLGDLAVTHLEPHPEGLLVSSVSRQPGPRGGHERSVLWVPSAEGGALERSGSPPLWEVTCAVPRRAAPAYVGGALLLLTDEGARVLPVERISGR